MAGDARPQQMRAVVRGRVQGVCFRAETASAARRLGLNGFARNLRDGTVEVIAAGDESLLQRLVEFLRHGPTLARVDGVEIDWTDRTPLDEGFRVRS